MTDSMDVAHTRFSEGSGVMCSCIIETVRQWPLPHIST